VNNYNWIASFLAMTMHADVIGRNEAIRKTINFKTLNIKQ